jgi:hypothetical protein
LILPIYSDRLQERDRKHIIENMRYVCFQSQHFSWRLWNVWLLEQWHRLLPMAAQDQNPHLVIAACVMWKKWTYAVTR